MTLRVLIASRREKTRERLRAALEEHGCDVRATCAHAAEAIAVSRRRRIDVCVVHLDLPGGGITVCRALAARKRPPRILVLAPAGREGDVTAAIRAGADGFIVDDLDPRRVPAGVVDVAAGRPVLSSGSTARLIAALRAPERPPGNENASNNPRREEPTC